MKRYIFGIIAVVVAIGAAAFNDHKKPMVDMYVFQYDPNGVYGYSETEVENENSAHWVYQGKNLSLCSNDDIKACRVSVTGSYVNNTTTPTQLSGVTIDAAESSTGIAFVQSITSPTNNSYSNKP